MDAKIFLSLYMSKIEEIINRLPIQPGKTTISLSYSNDRIPYIQHIPEIVDNVFDDFVKLLEFEDIIPRLNNSKCQFSEKYKIISRYLDDSNSDIYRYWYRYCCIDNEYREWEQPYFVELSNSGKLYERGYTAIEINNTPELIPYFRNYKIEKIIYENN